MLLQTPSVKLGCCEIAQTAVQFAGRTCVVKGILTVEFFTVWYLSHTGNLEFVLVIKTLKSLLYKCVLSGFAKNSSSGALLQTQRAAFTLQNLLHESRNLLLNCAISS